MAYPMTISILVHGFVLVANIILLGLTEGNFNGAVDPGEATGKRLHETKGVNEGKGSVDRFGSVSLQQLSHPAYYVNDNPVQSDPFLNNNHNSGKIDQNHITNGVEGHLHSDASGVVAVSDMHSLAAKLQFPRRTSWENGVHHRFVNTDQLHNPLLGEGNYHRDMNANDPDNVPMEQKAMYTYGQTVILKTTIKDGSVKRMQQLETVSSERNQAQYLTFGENHNHKIRYRTKDSLGDKANSANIANANGLEGEKSINNFKLDDWMADQSVLYLVAKRNEAVSPSDTSRMSLLDEDNSMKPVGYSQRDSELTLTPEIDDNAYKQSSSNPERRPENQEGLRSDWDEIAPKFRNSHGNHPIIKSIWSPELTVGKGNIDWSDQKVSESIKADFVPRGAYVDASRRIDQTVMYNPEETNLITNFNNADTDTFRDSNGQGEVYLIDRVVNSLPDTTNEEDSYSISSGSTGSHTYKYSHVQESEADNQGAVDPNNRPYNTDKFTDASDPNAETLTHRIGPNDSVGKFPGVSSSAQLMRKAAVPHSYDDYHLTAPVVSSPRNKGNGIYIQQQSKPRSTQEAFDPNGYISPQQLHEKQSSRWSTGKHTSHENVYESNGSKQKAKNSLAQNMQSESSKLNENSNIELQMMDTSQELVLFSQLNNAGYREFNAEERDLIAQDFSVPKQKQPNNIDRGRKNKVSLKHHTYQKNKRDAIYLALFTHAGPRIIETKSDKPNETSSGRSSHTATEQLHRSTSNKPNVGPFSINKNQATQESRMLKEKKENPHAAHLNENGNSGIEQLHIAGTLYRRPERPHMNLNHNMTTQKQSVSGQEKNNTVNVAYWDRTGIESTLMDIDLANVHKVPPSSHPSSQSVSTPESSSQIDLNVQFADDVILGSTPGKAVSKSISIDPPNSQMSLKYYSQSDWSHTAYDHVQQSKQFIQRIFSKQRSTTPIKDFMQESFQNHGKTSQTDHLSVRLKRDINNGGFLSSVTHSSDSHGDRKKRSADTVGNNLFHWSTMSRSTPSPVSTKSYRSNLEHNVNTVSSNNRIVPYSNHFTSLVPDDENSKSNPDQSIIRHLQHKLLKNHPRGHRRVRIGSRYSLSNLHKGALRGGYVYRNNQIRSNSLAPSIRRRKLFASGFLHEGHESSLNVLDHTPQNSFRLENYDHRRRSTDSLQLQKHSVKSIRKRSEGSELADHFTDNNNHYPEDDYDGGHRNGSNNGVGPHSQVVRTPEKLSEDYVHGAYGLQLPEQPPAGTNDNIDHDTVGFGLSYRAPAFIESRATWQYGAHRLDVPVAQSQLLDEDDNTTDSHTGDDGTKSGPLNQEQNEEDIAEGDHLGQPAFKLSLTEGQAQNYTDSDSTVHLEDRQDGDKQEETRRSESVIHLDLIQDTIGEYLKPKPNEQEDGNPLLHEEGNSHWESSLSEGYYDKSGEDYVAKGEEEGEKETGEETVAEGSGTLEKHYGEMNPSSEPEVKEEVVSEEPEPEYPEPEAEFPEPEIPEPEAEEPEPGDSDTHDEISYAEPEPNWETAKDIWGPAWELHIYVAGVGFAILAVYSLISILRLYKHKNLLSLAYFLSLNAIMALMGITRALYFLVDGYNTRGTFHPVLYYFLYSVGFPCITSAFSILFMALLQTTKMQLLPPKIQRTSILIMIIALHFMISFLTDFVVGYFSSAAMLMLVCQLATVIWGLFLFGGYLYIFKKLYRNAQWRQREMTRYQLSQIKLEGVTPITKTPKLTLNIAIRVTLVTAIFGLLFAGIITYSMFGVFSIFSEEVPKAWPWWFFKFSMRIVELAMCATMSYVATQPFRYNSEISTKKWNCSSVMFYFPCRRLCLCDEHELRDDGLHWIDNQLYANDSGLSVSGDINAFNINPVLVEESIPITSCPHPTSKHNTGTGVSDSGSTSSHRATSNTGQSQQGASRPTSLLVKENGLVRFRQEGDEDADPVVLSTEDELDLQDPEVMGNPFAAALAQHHRNLLLEEHPQDRKGRLELLLAGQGIILPDQFGESNTEPNQSKKLSFKSSLNRRRPIYNRTKSAPGGCDTPASTRSFCSSDTFLDGNASMWSFRPPSSIHLRDSIENYLDMNLDTPDIIDSPLRAPPRSRANSQRSRWRSGPFSRNSNPSSNRYFSSTSDLQSLQEYHDILELQQQQQHLQQESEPEHHSQDSMTFSMTSDMSLDGVGRSPCRLLRSKSDSLTGTSGIPRDLSFPSGYESAESDRAFGKDDWKQIFDNKRKVQNLLNDINDLCTDTSD